MQRLKRADFATLRKMEKCLDQCIKAEHKAKDSQLMIDALKQLLENTRELRLFFKLLLDPELGVYAADWTPVSRPLITWASRRYHE